MTLSTGTAKIPVILTGDSSEKFFLPFDQFRVFGVFRG
jgi:hypothetical protein